MAYLAPAGKCYNYNVWIQKASFSFENNSSVSMHFDEIKLFASNTILFKSFGLFIYLFIY